MTQDDPNLPSFGFILGLLLVLAIVSYMLTGVIRRFASRIELFDIPNERSSHHRPTPTGGGLVLVLGFVAGIPALIVGGLLDRNLAMALWIGGALVSLVGWLDDRMSVLPLARLLVHMAAAVSCVGWLGGVPVVSFGSLSWDAGLVGSVGAVVGLVWLMNLFNFMDGIDGIAGVEAVTTGTIGGILLWSAGAPGLALVAWGVVAISTGFLPWNWSPARIFMGDVGSVLLGFVFGALALAGQRTAQIPLPVMLLPMGVFICDATYTLVRRWWSGEQVHVAHRSHVYQRLVRRGWSHPSVVAVVALFNILLGWMAWFSWKFPARLPWVLLAAVVVLALGGGIALKAPQRPFWRAG